MDIELLVATLAFIVPMCFTPGPNKQHGTFKVGPYISSELHHDIYELVVVQWPQSGCHGLVTVGCTA